MLLLTFGCVRTADREARTITEIVGDTTVARTIGGTDSTLILRLVAELSIGEEAGTPEYQFTSIDEVVPGDGGALYAWDERQVVLRQYDSAGRFVRQIGRRGQGPGEYAGSNGIAVLPGGRLLLWDAMNGRMNVYDTAGRYERGWRASSRAIGPGGVFVDTAGGVYLRGPVGAPMLERVPPDSMLQGGWLLAVDPATGSPLRIVRAPPPAIRAPRVSVMRDGRPLIFSTVPFAPQSGWTWSPHGYMVAYRGDRYEVVLLRSSAPLRIERDALPVVIDPDERRNWQDRITVSFRRDDATWQWSGPPIPDHKPLIVGLTVGADGRIWVRRPLPSERIPDDELRGVTSRLPPFRWREAVAYDVFEADGRFVGIVQLPPRSALHWADGERIWVSAADSLDVPRIVRYRLEPPARDP